MMPSQEVRITNTEANAGMVYLVHNSLSGDAINTKAKLDEVTDNKVNAKAIAANTTLSLNGVGLIDGIYNAYLVDAAGNVSIASATHVEIDGTPPARLNINTVANNDVINLAEKNAGIDITGSSDAFGQTVTVTWVGTEKTATVQENGAWSVTYTTNNIPDDTVSSIISAKVSDAVGNEKTVEHSVRIKTISTNIAINTVAADDRIDFAERETQALLLPASRMRWVEPLPLPGVVTIKPPLSMLRRVFGVLLMQQRMFPMMPLLASSVPK